MARDTDRRMVSEAVRLSSYWSAQSHGRDFPSGTYVILATPYDENLVVNYGSAGQIKAATYTHFAEDGHVADRERITQDKRKRVLKLITQKDVV